MDYAPFARYPEHKLRFEPKAVRREDLVSLGLEDLQSNVSSLTRQLTEEASQKLPMPPAGWHWDGEVQSSEDISADCFMVRVVYTLRPDHDYRVVP